MSTKLEELDEQVLFLREEGMGKAEVAEKLNVSERTVQRSMRRLQESGKMLKKEIPNTQAVRDKLFDEHLDTYRTMRQAIRRTERLQDALEKELGFTPEFENKPCPTCGRFPLKSGDALKWQAAFKGSEAVNAQVTTLAKMYGQMADSVVLINTQIDDDLMLIFEELAQLDKPLARALYNRVIERSERRRQRLPEFGQVVEAQFRVLEEGKRVDED